MSLLLIFRSSGSMGAGPVIRLCNCHRATHRCVCVCVRNPIPFSKKWRKHGMDFICSGDKTVVAPRAATNLQMAPCARKKKAS